MNSTTILLIIVAYFGLLFGVSHLVSRKSSDNDAFFRANKKSPWWIIAIGMLGSSISGVSFVSVPGMVRDISFNYMQTVFGFFVGYVIIAHVLLPLYYRLNLTTIYGYLDQRFGKRSYKTGSAFFILSKSIGAAARLYIVTLILQYILFDGWGVPYWLNVSGTLLLIWLYTRRSGIKTVVFTDTIQTVIMIAALVIIIVQVVNAIGLPVGEIYSSLKVSPTTQIFRFGDWGHRQYFWKQFLSGVFIPIVMTGLDQDMMQKNLTIKTLRDAQKNMYWYGIMFVPMNFLFLTLGALLLMLASQNGIALPEMSDDILTLFATEHLGSIVYVLFVLGIIAAAFSSADSALTSLTTSFSIDILGIDDRTDDEKSNRYRKITHISFAVLMVFIILIIRELSSRSIIDAIYTIASYTYGPLLGLYVFGLFTRHGTNDKLVPYIAIFSPVFCYWLAGFVKNNTGYEFGYELLMLNGAITFVLLYLAGKTGKQTSKTKIS